MLEAKFLPGLGLVQTARRMMMSVRGAKLPHARTALPATQAYDRKTCRLVFILYKFDCV